MASSDGVVCPLMEPLSGKNASVRDVIGVENVPGSRAHGAPAKRRMAPADLHEI